jgi:hypothetical protein
MVTIDLRQLARLVCYTQELNELARIYRDQGLIIRRRLAELAVLEKKLGLSLEEINELKQSVWESVSLTDSSRPSPF